MSKFAIVTETASIPSARGAGAKHALPFADMLPGQRVDIPLAEVPMNEMRAELMRHMRANPMQVFVTRTQKKTQVVSVWRTDDTTAEAIAARPARKPRAPKGEPGAVPDDEGEPSVDATKAAQEGAGDAPKGRRGK